MTTARLPTLHAIESAIWQELQACTHDRAHAWRTPVLATSDARGDADARVVVLREVEPEAGRLRFFTDARSPKRSQIETRPRGVLVMWSPSLAWQLRVSVGLEVHLDGPAVAARWARVRTSASAMDYLAPSAPGSALRAEPASDPACAEHERPSHFAMVDATVHAVDWLELGTEGHRRARFAAAGACWLQP
jgi:hypothetical protein